MEYLTIDLLSKIKPKETIKFIKATVPKDKFSHLVNVTLSDGGEIRNLKFDLLKGVFIHHLDNPESEKMVQSLTEKIDKI